MADVIINPVFKSIRKRIGNIVFYERGGKQFARIHVIPKNPDTAAQRKRRRTFSDSVSAWQSLTMEEKKQWRNRASLAGRRGYNVFISEYLNDGVKIDNNHLQQESENKEVI